ncbi:hypothetical protein ACVXG9_13070 [Escherichia coli]
MDVTPLMRVDGFAMLYTGLVLSWRASPPVLSPTLWLEGYNDNKDEFYLLVLIAALGGYPAGECQPSGASCSSVLN